MPWSIRWLDDDPPIFEAVLSDPFVTADHNAFLEELVVLLNSREGPLLCVLDVSGYADVSEALLVDKRVLGLSVYGGRVRHIAMVPGSSLSRSLARIAGRMLGYRDLFHFVDSYGEGVAYIRRFAAQNPNGSNGHK